MAPGKINHLYPVALFCLIAALIPWANGQFTHAINTDIAYLTLSAQRMLHAMSMSEGYFDTNPPLSVIIQIPAVLLSKFGIPLYYATNIYIFALLTASFTATALLLRKIPNLNAANQTIILCCFLVTATIKTGYDFGQKDHILALALFPLTLLQILITQKIKIHPILYWSVLTAGSILILLKPHYGLIPASIFLHRAITQKRLSIIFDKDFITLTTAALTYIAVIFIIFPDFITIILPEILKYYASDTSPHVTKIGLILMAQAAIPLLICQIFLKKAPPFISIFACLSILCLIPFIIQGKGWAYHATAANIFFYSAVGLFISHLITTTLNAIRMQKISYTASAIIITALLIWMISKNYQKPDISPTHAQYKNTEFTKILQNCEQPCSFLMLHDMINMHPELSVYTGREHASRFPVLWFIPHLINPNNTQNLTKTRELTAKIAQDFKRWQPDIIFVAHLPHPFIANETFNHRDYLLQTDPQFTQIWAQYTLEKSINIDRIEYMARKKPNEDLIRYDIYRKTKHD